nr:MAG TPA: Protein of unknown function (DUF1192) [Bacteriophage sp.]
MIKREDAMRIEDLKSWTVDQLKDRYANLRNIHEGS